MGIVQSPIKGENSDNDHNSNEDENDQCNYMGILHPQYGMRFYPP